MEFMKNLKEKSLKLLPYLPFFLLVAAFFVAVYHIKVYW